MFYRNRFRMAFLASLVLCLGVLSSCGSDNDGNTPQPGVFTWNVQQDPIGGDDLREVSALDDSNVWSVGHRKIILFGTK